jgi:lipoprotein-anchoring transpeptidase ErfK/SrfK
MPRVLRYILSLLLLAACATPAPPTPAASVVPATPTTLVSDWIEVVLAEQTAYLWHGDQLEASLSVSTGVGDSPSTTTSTGEFTVDTMYPGPEETVPGVFVRDVVIFDWDHGNGFHSLPMDANGIVLDPTVGKPASAGCIRVAESRRLYDFAQVGMRVLIR